MQKSLGRANLSRDSLHPGLMQLWNSQPAVSDATVAFALIAIASNSPQPIDGCGIESELMEGSANE